jgi:hypothetical protein
MHIIMKFSDRSLSGFSARLRQKGEQGPPILAVALAGRIEGAH